MLVARGRRSVPRNHPCGKLMATRPEKRRQGGGKSSIPTTASRPFWFIALESPRCQLSCTTPLSEGRRDRQGKVPADVKVQ